MLRNSLGAALVLGTLSTLACSANGPGGGSGVASTGSGGAGINTGPSGSGTGAGGPTNINTGDTGSGGTSSSAGGDGNSAMQCDGKFKGYLRDFTIADPSGMVIMPGASTPTKLQPDGSTAWWTPGATAPTAETVNGVVYKVSPDFEVVTHAGAAKQYNVDDPQIVQATPGSVVMLGADQTPVYAGNATTGTITTTGAANFATWFHNTDGINVGQELDLQFVPDPNKPTDPNAYTFSSGATGSACSAADPTYCAGFYPIDGKQLGNEGNTHNYHMTFELHLKFKYHAGQVFTFTGDDDVWAYINNKLAVNLGGLHIAETSSVNLDTLGLTEGSVYPLDFFWCERHVTASNFHIDTSLEVVDCGTVVVK
jgi:fibro-slime domain-containing protein